MGLDINSIKLLIATTKKEIKLKKVLTIGRQNIHVKDKELSDILAGNFPGPELGSFMQADHTYCEGLLKMFGAQMVDSVDVSDYEQATIVHDMNLPIPDKYKGKYDTVIDAGSLEHVFNFPVAIKNCMELINPGGIYIGITPANNFFGHGFYQFSPELYYRVFSTENGFEVKRLILYIDNPASEWYEIKDPKEVNDRITLINSHPVYIFIIAEKKINTIPFLTPPQQSDYNNLVWKGGVTLYREAYQTKGLLHSIKKIIPVGIKDYGLRIINRYKILSKQLGNLKSFTYKKVTKN